MSAILSPCGSYRYRLERDLSLFGPVGAFIMVNPSTADAELDDQTIRKVKGFATRLGWSRVIVGNVFAYRATDIAQLATVDDPVGPQNGDHLSHILADAESVVCAWGALQKLPPRLRDQWRTVTILADALGRSLQCLGTVKDGHPKHPLLVGYSATVADWSAPLDSDAP
ncbi:DUF1643 domain-containing protein [Aurantiacibacter gilvus]|uniref:DUF1643 domain-containing protein n=1 Tax=Aurantiacibacter gilvus TaxID=3139141 RepID=A0ABU9IHJ2_9SPHN